MNPQWWLNIPTPYNPTYPNWDSLPSLTTDQLKAKIKEFGLPDLQVREEVWKVPPWDTFRSFACNPGAWSRPWSVADGACITIAFMNCVSSIMWCASPTIFFVTSQTHAFNVGLLMKPDKTIGAFMWDGALYDGGMEFKNASELTGLHEIISIGMI